MGGQMAIVTDGEFIVNTSGLRVAKKVDYIGYPEKAMRYRVDVYYKGQEMHYDYGERVYVRDRMFAKIVEAVQGRKEGVPT